VFQNYIQFISFYCLYLKESINIHTLNNCELRKQIFVAVCKSTFTCWNHWFIFIGNEKIEINLEIKLVCDEKSRAQETMK
jgi:hypothetical protein